MFKGIPWEDWPTYTLNKAFALSALLLLTSAVIRKCSANGHSNAETLRMATLFGLIHVTLSLALLRPVYYEKLFVQGHLTAAAGLSMALGAVAWAVMATGPRKGGNQHADGGVRILAALAFVVGLHAMLQGFAGWFSPSQWPGMMPPITLLAFLLGLAAVAVAVAVCRKHTSSASAANNRLHPAGGRE